MMFAGATARVDRKLALAPRTIRSVPFDRYRLTKYGKVLCCRDDLTPMGGLIAEPNDTAPLLIFHIVLARMPQAMLRAVSAS